MKSKEILLTIFSVVVIFGIVMILPKGNSGPADLGEEMDTFAKCLNDAGAEMYGIYWCTACKAQKDDFGASFQYINYIECSEEADLCQEKDIEYTPTWILADGYKLVGRQSLETLADQTGCTLPAN